MLLTGSVADGGGARIVAAKVGWGELPLSTTPIVSSWHDTAQGGRQATPSTTASTRRLSSTLSTPATRGGASCGLRAPGCFPIRIWSTTGRTARGRRSLGRPPCPPTPPPPAARSSRPARAAPEPTAPAVARAAARGRSPRPPAGTLPRWTFRSRRCRTTPPEHHAVHGQRRALAGGGLKTGTSAAPRTTHARARPPGRSRWRTRRAG